MIHQLRALAARLRGLFGDRKADRELDDEVETHLRLLTERYIRQGMTEAEAEWAARRQFGNVTLLQEVNREMRGFRVIDTLVQDLRYGARMLRKNPGFTMIAVITLSLGIGANTAIFSLVNTILFRPLPVREPQRLVSVFPTIQRTGEAQAFSYPNYVDVRDRNDVFSDLAAFHFAGMSLSRNGANEIIYGYLVSGNYFEMLGVKAAVGRGLSPEEYWTAGADSVAVAQLARLEEPFGT